MNISRILKEGHQIKIRSVDNKTVEGKNLEGVLAIVMNEMSQIGMYLTNECELQTFIFRRTQLGYLPKGTLLFISDARIFLVQPNNLLVSKGTEPTTLILIQDSIRDLLNEENRILREMLGFNYNPEKRSEEPLRK
jgi:hypothetical protein